MNATWTYLGSALRSVDNDRSVDETLAAIEAVAAGFKAGVELFARMKDGRYVVGVLEEPLAGFLAGVDAWRAHTTEKLCEGGSA